MTSSRDGIGQRSETVRRSNLSAIVRALHDRGPLSRSELVALTGLTRNAIRGLVGEIVGAGLATEEPAERLGTPGRPSPRVCLVQQAAVVLALEISVDTLAAAVVGMGGEVLDVARVDRARGHTSVDEILAELEPLIRAVLPVAPEQLPLVGVGVAVEGIVRREDGFVWMAPNLGWRRVPLGRRLEEVLRLDVPVSIANDADVGALAEHRRGAAMGADNVLFIYGEVGVGGGVIVDGRPLTGVAGYGGEVGHFPVSQAGRACGCGSFGCWETEVGEDALLVRAGRSAGSGRGAMREVLAAAAAGSARELAACSEVGRWLGTGLAGFVNLLNPEVVVLGGFYGPAFSFVIDALAAELDSRALPASRTLARVVPGSLGLGASLLGAAELAFESILADPAGWAGLRDATVEEATA
jgi:predicted NBD/HSP70 family sugar kinase